MRERKMYLSVEDIAELFELSVPFAYRGVKRLTDESWINYQKGKGNEEFQKYMEDLTDMQNHVLPYLQSFCSLEEKSVQERRDQQVMDKKESKATAVTGVEKQANVKEAGKAKRKSVPQKKETVGKEKKLSVHERLEINKKII